MIVECFARRLMAPFQGVLQVLRIGHGEAESTDGMHWVLYAAHPDILAHSGLSEVRFGTWSVETGLRRAAVRGSATGALIERIGGPLVGALEAFAGQVPFPLHDRLECWLLDGETGEPLVLVDSRLPDEPLPRVDQPRWLPGQAARQEFSDLALLERMIAQRAGRRPRAAWFERADDGTATDLATGRRAARHFPRLLLTRHWAEPCQRRLADAFVGWWAPALLQLQHLSDPERRQLERAAAARAGVLARLFRLYPKIIDRPLVRAARVQARLQGAHPVAAGYREPFLWSD